MRIVIIRMIPNFLTIFRKYNKLLKQVLIITGPTGVGKTEFVSKLAASFPAEIINADMGQMYEPLTIGTAKPAWQKETVPQHLFDIINEPIDFSIVQFRKIVIDLVQEIWSRGNTPIIVGGSTLYIKSLFYTSADLPIKNLFNTSDLQKNIIAPNLWEILNQIDSKRAAQLHPNDRYRIQRALDIWQKNGVLPSECIPKYEPISENITLFVLNNIRDELYKKNDQRVRVMMEMGWLAEVANLESKWHNFLRRKKIIGYELLLDYLDQKINNQEACIKAIQKRVRNYAKKQQTFWRGLCADLKLQEKMKERVFEINLTLLDVNLYIKQLLMKLKLD